MILLWTTRDQFFSRLVRWGLETDCSHFAIGFDCKTSGHGMVFHSNINGVHIDYFSNFLKHNNIIHALDFKKNLSLGSQEAIYQKLIMSNYGSDYDYPALMFWACAIMRYKMFDTPFPEKNLWGTDAGFLCTELARGLSGLKLGQVSFPAFDNLDMKKPETLYEELEKCDFLKPASWVYTLQGVAA